jgi:hypothetical protein
MKAKNEPTVKRDLSAQDICALIKACGEYGVAQLKLGDLELAFTSQTERSWLHQARHAPTLHSHLPEAAISEAHPNEQNEHSLEQAELALKNDQLAELLLTDPAAYEEAVLREDLVDEET